MDSVSVCSPYVHTLAAARLELYDLWVRVGRNPSEVMEGGVWLKMWSRNRSVKMVAVRSFVVWVCLDMPHKNGSVVLLPELVNILLSFIPWGLQSDEGWYWTLSPVPFRSARIW